MKVAYLIAHLQTLDPNAEVKIQGRYECGTESTPDFDEVELSVAEVNNLETRIVLVPDYNS